ncbi:MAG: YncE family protein [Actinophytocola sp.]|uniref:YncE family protein n=1 Tax=Actinophytocola sp. TaxID=1872138 RepID=UPI003D6B2878
MLRRMVVVVLGCCAAVGTACSSGEPSDELMVSDDPAAATAARSPAATAEPAGSVRALPGTPTAMIVDADTRLLAVAVDEPPAVLLYPLDDAGSPASPRKVPLPGPADTLSLARPGGPLLAAAGSSGELVRIALPGGSTAPAAIRGEPVSAADLGDRTLVAVRDRKAVAVLGGDKVYRMISGGLASADQVLSTGEGAVVFDRLRNALFEVDVRAGSVDEGLRTGEGSTNAVTDRFGRVLVADTKGGALMAFSLDPLLMRQRYPVPGAPYGLAYDPKRDLLWVTLTATNEVVGFDVAGGEPEEKHRFPTVEQPNNVAVDPISGRVIVASATGKGIQVIAV